MDEQRPLGRWTASRPYRVAAELMISSFVALALLMSILSRSAGNTAYYLLGIQATYWVGVLAGFLGGCARGLVDFWRRDSYDMSKRDYWKHLLPTYIGCVFGFLMVLVWQLTFRVLGVENTGSDSVRLALLAMVCMFAGMFTDYAESVFSKKFSQIGP